MEKKKVNNLIIKFINKEISESEKSELMDLFSDEKYRALFKEYLRVNHILNSDHVFDGLDAYKSLLKEKSIRKKERVFSLTKVVRYAVAACAVFLLGYGILKSNYNSNNSGEIKIVTSPILPGNNNAILTLENGKQINLKDTLYTVEGIVSNGKDIVYSKKETKELVYNCLTVPRGGQYVLELSDGTKVWLNSESKLKYPKCFVEGNRRDVELVYGEAYFEVSPSTLNKGSRFNVLTKGQEVEVLGTQFNIKAYKDEETIYTTLIEGSVALNYNSETEKLKPGQQSVFNKSTRVVTIQEVEIKYEIAWKQGLFSFKNKPLKEIMKVLSRWYDVDVVFQDEKLEEVVFKGQLSKDENLEDLMKLINKTNYIKDYEIKNNTVIIKD